MPGSTYDLLLRLRSDTPIELVISVGSDPIVASVVDEGTAHVGQFVATTKSETLQIALYGSEEGARVYLDEVSIYPGGLPALIWFKSISSDLGRGLCVRVILTLPLPYVYETLRVLDS